MRTHVAADSIPGLYSPVLDAHLFAIDANTQLRKKDSLLECLQYIVNTTIEEGKTYPFSEPFGLDECREYFFKHCTVICVKVPAIVRKQSTLGVDALKDLDIDWKEALLGVFYVKPNYAGRCSHICNGGFFVHPAKRGQGIGRELAKAYLYFAPRLGYKSSVFNLVFATNTASVRLWERLNFTRVGVIKDAAFIKGRKEPVDAFVYQYTFPPLEKNTV
ncbi:L-azetidine-2-carboxylic acid acetyltransferase [Schizosaccharomyces japonicus yFS275]|uniref:L-azetidine-2-carboxylic acid acetyltransferase n=1 Tax=Schizosaccharomyces japonicus (strain yFS275 / FY16936) TaxID=402676 RepID=B6K245_SCHJY|nr:L-azetidine-2-carboxylic acid acetyltransferase [Schizosaccharomyces japonicus yFS275]EEB07226.1 L-azetidine-2-carboxylic acid acetyltransferase [Schizosaccharomyces japonicus yFS275]